jgi:molybdate transport system substrate-binding protein
MAISRRTAVVAFAIAAAQARAEGARSLTIAAASDLRFALDEVLAPLRAAYPKAAIEVVYGASGKLATQIRNGAPFDVFLSADIAFANDLHAAGLGTAPPQVYAIGRLAAWSTDAELGRLPLDALVNDARVKRFAIANPQHAPYGRRAMEALRTRGLEDAIKPKLVLGDNVAQAATFVETGAAQAGLVAHALVLAPALAGKGAWTLVPAQWHSPLEQAMVVIRRAASNPLAAAFAQHMQSAPVRERLKQHGFAPAV